MTEDEQRIAIAEFCGIKCQDVDIELSRFGALFGTENGQIVLVPDYLHDLNAMHEAEKALSPDRKRDYISYLFDFYDECATAAQRAEALLRTIGKWQ
jgi:hypothetical protein